MRTAVKRGLEPGILEEGEEHDGSKLCEWDDFLDKVYKTNGVSSKVSTVVSQIIGSEAIECTRIAGVLSQLRWTGIIGAPLPSDKDNILDKAYKDWEIDSEFAKLDRDDVGYVGSHQVRLAVTGVLRCGQERVLVLATQLHLRTRVLTQPIQRSRQSNRKYLEY